MSLLMDLKDIIEESNDLYDKLQVANFTVADFKGSHHNILARGDNLSFMKYLQSKTSIAGKLQMIYVDPPFFSKANYLANYKVFGKNIKPLAYEDKWSGNEKNYLKMLFIRLKLMRDLLSETGTIWIHLDWHIVHYVKLLADEIFGKENFVNEIIWTYKSGGTSKKHFARKHDTILLYSKTKNYYLDIPKEKSYNRNYKPYKFKGVEEYEDELGWYTKVNMKDVWQLNMVGRTSSERTGYATQKPEALLRRIIESCTKKGDYCADFFGGSGTLAKTSLKLGRKFISCDSGNLAIGMAQKRLYEDEYMLLVEDDYNKGNIYVVIEDGRVILDKYEISEEYMNICPSEKKYIKAIKDNESLSLIDYWSIDYDYNGKFHCSDDVFIRNKNELVYETKIKGSKFSIRTVDVFGNTSRKVFEV